MQFIVDCFVFFERIELFFLIEELNGNGNGKEENYLEEIMGNENGDEEKVIDKESFLGKFFLKVD